MKIFCTLKKLGFSVKKLGFWCLVPNRCFQCPLILELKLLPLNDYKSAEVKYWVERVALKIPE
jgi:hypothetical protein